MSNSETAPAVVIGASTSGLATAACLKEAGVTPVILERSDAVGSAWRGHYDRLHLHTPKAHSGLPGLPMPASYPKYPARDQVVAYLEDYAAHHGLTPRFGHEVTALRRQVDAGNWRVEHSQGVLHARHVVIATGLTRVPKVPTWPGTDDFGGELLHSSKYKTGADFKGKRVLVVGFGNSACEIAIDLHEQGAIPAMAVRSAQNVLPRDVFGMPVLQLGIINSKLPAELADFLSKPLMNVLVGDITEVGLRQLPYGPMVQIRDHSRIPLLDIGTMKLLRDGSLKVHPGIERFTESGVVFTDGTSLDVDAVVLATGFEPRLDHILPDGLEDGWIDETGRPWRSGHAIGPGLWACGFFVAPGGMIREAAIEAKRIAARIASAP